GRAEVGVGVAAVTRPAALTGGWRVVIFSSVESGRMPSSWSKRKELPSGPFTSSPSISSRKRPLSRALAANWCERNENSSHWRRDRPHLAATISADECCGTIWYFSVSIGEGGKNGCTGGAVVPSEPKGTRVIDSTPAAMTASC